MNVIYNGPNNEHLFSLQCEDSAIGIDNPEDLPVYREGDNYILAIETDAYEYTLKPGDTFILPDSIGYEIVEHPLNGCKSCNNQGLYHCAHPEECGQIKIGQLARLKLKSLPEKDLFDQVLGNTPQEVKDNVIRQMAVIDFKEKLKKEIFKEVTAAYPNKEFALGLCRATTIIDTI